MKLSKRGEYALRALIDMGIAHDLERPLVQIGDLAEKENLPIKFLEQILMQLKEGGYIESKRGKLGGYFLLMPAKKIKIGQVIRLIDGPLAPIACVSLTAYEPCTCPDQEHCGLHMLMNDVRNAIANILDRFTLSDTVEMTLRKIKRNKPEIPFIESLLSKPLSPPLAVNGRAVGLKKRTKKPSPAPESNQAAQASQAAQATQSVKRKIRRAALELPLPGLSKIAVPKTASGRSRGGTRSKAAEVAVKRKKL